MLVRVSVGTRRRVKRTAGCGPVALVAALAAVVVLLLAPISASAHSAGSTAVTLDVRSNQVSAVVQLPIDALGLAMDQPLTASTIAEPAKHNEIAAYLLAHVHAQDNDGTAWRISVAGGQVETIDGTDQLVFHLEFARPQGAAHGPSPSFELTYDAVVHRVLNHEILVTTRTSNESGYTVLGILDFSRHTINVPLVSAPNGTPFRDTVRLGIHHIAGGADHLLFLAMLLLPAPLRARRGRWVHSAEFRSSCWRVVHVVTAFSIGHSVTLALAALGYVSAPTRLVESLIAVSILVSAVHAIRPLTPHSEPWIAGGFGLVHGLAFATLLGDLGLTRGSLLSNLLGFNLGIELTQLFTVALLMPSLLVLSTTPTYRVVRVALASFGLVMAAAWLAERTTVLSNNPLSTVSDMLIAHPFAIAGGLALAATATRMATVRRDRICGGFRSGFRPY